MGEEFLLSSIKKNFKNLIDKYKTKNKGITTPFNFRIGLKNANQNIGIKLIKLNFLKKDKIIKWKLIDPQINNGKSNEYDDKDLNIPPVNNIIERQK